MNSSFIKYSIGNIFSKVTFIVERIFDENIVQVINLKPLIKSKSLGL